MALSNIFREPRREITESCLGIILLGGYIAADAAFGVWLQNRCGFERFSDGSVWHHVPWGLGMLIGIGITVAFVAVLLITHEIGEGVCDALAERGVELRPKVRPRR